MPMLSPNVARASPCDPPSVTHRKPSRSRAKPCGKANRPAPKLSTRLPSRSNFRIGSKSVPAHWFPPHRSRIHRCSPSGSGMTPLMTPRLLPSGSFSQPKVARYGLVVDVWAVKVPPPATVNNTKPTRAVRPARWACRILSLSEIAVRGRDASSWASPVKLSSQREQFHEIGPRNRQPMDRHDRLDI